MFKDLFLISLLVPFLCTAQEIDYARIASVQDATKQTNLKKVQELLLTITLTDQEKEFLLSIAQEMVVARSAQVVNAQRFLPSKELSQTMFIGLNCGMLVSGKYLGLNTAKQRICAHLGFASLVTAYLVASGWNVSRYENLYKDAVKIQDLLCPWYLKGEKILIDLTTLRQ